MVSADHLLFTILHRFNNVSVYMKYTWQQHPDRSLNCFVLIKHGFSYSIRPCSKNYRWWGKRFVNSRYWNSQLISSFRSVNYFDRSELKFFWLSRSRNGHICNLIIYFVSQHFTIIFIDLKLFIEVKIMCLPFPLRWVLRWEVRTVRTLKIAVRYVLLVVWKKTDAPLMGP
jgi:hypothetical protein